MRVPAAVAGVLGGLCWLAALVVEEAVGGGMVDALTWAGIALLAPAVVGAGASLVSRSATWLRVLVAVGLIALVWSVLQVLRESFGSLAVHAAAGAVAAVVSVVALGRVRPADPQPAGRRVRGSHAR